MTTAITTEQAPTITPEQLALIKKTIAKDATATELELFLYDNARRGIHPLDKLLHFTKRGGKYVPVTSIDLMRSRAAMTQAYGGQDDAIFVGTPKTADFAATVTVYRFVQGQRCPFTATARWSEYKPDHDMMWQKMPHTLLGKCAEALALRKGFPQELSGLYEAAELAQADNETIRQAAPPLIVEATPTRPPAPEGFVYLERIDAKTTKGGRAYADVTLSTGEIVMAFGEMVKLLEQLAQDQVAVQIETEKTPKGYTHIIEARTAASLLKSEPAPPENEIPF